MHSTGFHHGLIEYHRGEVIGEVLFDGLLATLTSDRHRYVMGTMLQLETETKARLRPVMQKHGLAISEEPSARAEGMMLAAAMKSLAWLDVMQALRRELEDTYVPRYEAIARQAPPEDRAFCESMVVHERSLLEVAVRELAGDEQTSVELIVPQLRYPLAPWNDRSLS